LYAVRLLDRPYSLAVASVAAPLCLWLGLGLRADGRSDEAIDEVLMEGPRRFDWMRVGDNVVSVFHVSTCVIALGAASLIVALWQPPRAGRPGQQIVEPRAK
jgi:hypothetical protein